MSGAKIVEPSVCRKTAGDHVDNKSTIYCASVSASRSCVMAQDIVLWLAGMIVLVVAFFELVKVF